MTTDERRTAFVDDVDDQLTAAGHVQPVRFVVRKERPASLRDRIAGHEDLDLNQPQLERHLEAWPGQRAVSRLGPGHRPRVDALALRGIDVDQLEHHPAWAAHRVHDQFASSARVVALCLGFFPVQGRRPLDLWHEPGVVGRHRPDPGCRHGRQRRTARLDGLGP